jgi:CHAD domain-containing protein
MASELKGKRAATREARKIFRRQLARSLEHLDGRHLCDESVHSARKQIKKARATLRLLRPRLSHKQYRAANTRLRDAARPLSAARDAAVLRKALQRIQTGRQNAGIRREVMEVERMLAREQSNAQHRLVSRDGVPHSRRLLKQVRARAARFHLGRHGWSTIGAGAGRVYRQGRKALQAVHCAPSDAAFHEWRKQVKYLRHQLELLRPIWPGALGTLTRKLESLGDQLGDDHDLVVLRAKLTAPDSPLQAGAASRALLGKLDREKAALRRKALGAGARIYQESPASFCCGLRQHWREWRKSR